MTSFPIIDVAVNDPSWDRHTVFDPEKLQTLTSKIISDLANDLLECEISLSLVSDDQIQEINRDHRGFDKPTNVLSFPMLGAYDDVADAPKPILLGDIIVAFETVTREAAAEEKRFSDHFIHLYIHGLLHLLGYDHETDNEAEEMEGLEIKYLANLGIANPYA